MQNHPAIPDYREILLDDFTRRNQANPRYSLRAYARDLDLSPSRLSEIFARKNGLSVESAARVAKVIPLSESERAFFCDLVAAQHARSLAQRRNARARVLARTTAPTETVLPLDQFRYISNWHFLALVELAGTHDFRNDPAWIARRLSITELEAKDAVLVLKRLGILAETEGRLRVVGEFRTTTDSVPSKAIRKFHSQILHKAERAMHLQPIEERDLSAIILPISTADLPMARKMIQEFRRELNRKLGATEHPKDEVYSLSVQFVRLSHKESP